MDLQAACAGFFYALVTAVQFVAAGCSRRRWSIGADCNSRIARPAAIMKIYPLFGDGAGAVLLGPGAADQGLDCLHARGRRLGLPNCSSGRWAARDCR